MHMQATQDTLVRHSPPYLATTMMLRDVSIRQLCISD